MFDKYQKLISENPEGYWFRRKLYGWGWTPVKWQGWAVTFGYVAILVALGLSVDSSSSNKEVVDLFILPFIILTALFVRILYKKGESPRWQWGDNNKNEE
ncbi:MAG TPA: hypothetical protein P5056_03680 [Candidatus Paceibacterota bacterium]|nr:hypothetical protein [Candidatus Paceibacterota bacterium]